MTERPHGRSVLRRQKILQRKCRLHTMKVMLGGGLMRGWWTFSITSLGEGDSEQCHSHGSASSFNSSQDLNKLKRSTAVTDVTEE